METIVRACYSEHADTHYSLLFLVWVESIYANATHYKFLYNHFRGTFANVLVNKFSHKFTEIFLDF